MEESHGSLLHFLYNLGIPRWIPEPVFFSWVLIIFLGLSSFFATKNLKKIPTSLQGLLELIVEILDNFTKGIIGKEGSKYTPLIGSFFIYIFLMNSLVLIPGMLSPTSNFNTTIALAIVTFVSVQYFSIRKNGILGWLKHYAGEPLWMAPLMFPIHIIGEMAKPFSLSVRLFANIFGEDTAVIIIIGIIPPLLKYFIPIPTYLFMLALSLLTIFVQSLIFSMLSAIYISIMVSEHE